MQKTCGDEKILTPTLKPSSSSEQDGFLMSSQASGGYYLHLKQLAKRMRINPTPAEKFLTNYLNSKGLLFQRQKIICPYIVDFYFSDKGLIIELDGEPHNKIKQMNYDTDRDILIMGLRLKVIRFENRDILKNPEKVFNLYRDKNLVYREWDITICRHNNKFITKGWRRWDS